MTDRRVSKYHWRVDTIEGLREAGILEAIYFNPVSGRLEVFYTENWNRILMSGLVITSNRALATAFVDDDLAAMRLFVEREATRLASEGEPSEEDPPKRNPEGGESR